MLVRLQQAMTLGLLATSFAWAAVWFHAGHAVTAWLGGALLLFGYALFLALEFLFVRLVHRDDPSPRASRRHLLRAWWHEVLTAPRVFCWRQPFRSKAVPDWLPPTRSRGRRGVLLVHGFVCNRGVWNPWMRAFRQRGTPYIAVDLEPVFGSIDCYSEALGEAARRIETATGRPPLVVAHSIGGLAVRAWLAHTRANVRLERVVTIGTPHAGTWLARFSFSVNGRQMRRSGSWLRKLETLEGTPHHARFTCFYSHCDNIVFPASTATLPGADNRHVAGSAHVELLSQPMVFNEVLRLLDAPSPPAPRPETP